MAAVSVSFDGTVISLAQSDADNGTWDKANSSQTPTQETNFVWNGTPNQSNQASNNVAGIEFEDDAAIDFTTPKVVFAKVMMSNPGVIDLTVAKGYWYEVGEGVNGGTWNYDYYIAGLYAGEYPIRDTWRVLAIDPNVVAWRDAVAGTVDLTTVDYYAEIADAAAQAKTDNVIHARLDYLTYGQGLTLVGGDGGDADGTLDDFLTFDFEDATSTGRMGVILPGADENIINGFLNIGTATATVVNDSNRFLVFPHHLVAEGFGGVNIGMSNASNDVNLTAYTFKGLGNATVKQFFDTAIEVFTAGDTITLPAHGFNTGDLVTYSNEGGTNLTGLTSGTQYFVNALSVNSLALYAIGATVGRQNSFSDTTRVGLTADSAPGANHSLTRDPDTRFDYTVTGTTGVGHTLNSCTIDGARIVTLTSKAAITGGFILRTGSIVTGSAVITGVNVSGSTLEEGAALFNMTAAELDVDLSGCTFVASDEGHAVRATTAAAAEWDHITSGYWNPAVDGWNFLTSQAFASEQLNTQAAHDFTTGDAVYYNDEGGVEGIGLTDGNKYYVNVVDTDTVTLHLTKAAAVAGSSAINLTTSGAETQSLYSSKATLFNDTSSGTLAISVVGGNAPSVRNAPGATTTVTQTVTLSVTIKDLAGAAIPYASVTIQDQADDSIVSEGIANNLGVYTDSTFNYVSDVDVDITVRKSSPGDTRYVDIFSPGLIASTGMAVSFAMSPAPFAGLVPMVGVLKHGVQSEDINDASITVSIDLPAGTSRKLVVAGMYWDGSSNLVSDVVTYDGDALTSINALAVNEGSEWHKIFLYYHDIPDSDEGIKDVVFSVITPVNIKAIAFAILDDVVTGAAESNDTDSGNAVTGNPSLALNNTTADSFSVGLGITDDLDSPTATGDATNRVRRSDVTRDAALQSVTILVADRSTSGAHNIGADFGANSKSWVYAGASFAKN